MESLSLGAQRGKQTELTRRRLGWEARVGDSQGAQVEMNIKEWDYWHKRRETSMKDDDFVPTTIPTGEPPEPEPSNVPPYHPLFTTPVKVDVNMTRTHPQTTIYDWVPGFRGNRLQATAGGGSVQLANPLSLLEMLAGGRLTGAAEEDATNLFTIAREFLQAIAMGERVTKQVMKDSLEAVETKEKTPAQAKADLGLTPQPAEGQTVLPDPGAEPIGTAGLHDGPEPEPVRRERTEEELNADLDAASASEGDMGFLDFDDPLPPEPPPMVHAAPKTKVKRRRKKKS